MKFVFSMNIILNCGILTIKLQSGSSANAN